MDVGGLLHKGTSHYVGYIVDADTFVYSAAKLLKYLTDIRPILLIKLCLAASCGG